MFKLFLHVYDMFQYSSGNDLLKSSKMFSSSVNPLAVSFAFLGILVPMTTFSPLLVFTLALSYPFGFQMLSGIRSSFSETSYNSQSSGAKCIGPIFFFFANAETDFT